MLSVQNGVKGTYEEVEEVRYATQFESATIDISLRDDNGNLTKEPRKVQGLESEPFAIGFETRNIGITLEAEPRISGEGKTLIVSFVAQHIRLKSIERLVIERENVTEKTVRKVTQEQPRFSVKKVSSELSIESGDHRLIGTFALDDTANTLELFILGAELLPTK
jgi:hypothetical protein